MLCLSLNIYHEAGNQQYVGKEAVADVIINRAIDNGTNVCTETLRPHQFSWVRGHSIAYLEKDKRSVLHKAKSNDAEMEAWNESQTVAALALSKSYVPRFNFTQYHTTAVHPVWSKHVHQVRIGSHLFSKGKQPCSKISHSLHVSSHVVSSTLPKQTNVTTVTTRQMKLWLQHRSLLTPPLPQIRMVTPQLPPIWETVQPSRQSTVNTLWQTLCSITKRLFK